KPMTKKTMGTLIGAKPLMQAQMITGQIILSGIGIVRQVDGNGKNLTAIAGQIQTRTVNIHIPGVMMVSIIQRAGKMQTVISIAIRGKEVAMGHIMTTKEAQMPQVVL
ncbi:MAG: hypothetical protein KKG01_03505, partial [Candidatus Omnitrophica bacterium]|nr:hypothetical protein [Candidatus Omnitrophota bacterium]